MVKFAIPRKSQLSAAVLGAALAVAPVTPALARVDNVDCNWLGMNCRGFWDHGVYDTTVFSAYKHLDNSHGASVYGTKRSGESVKDDTGCYRAGVWTRKAQLTDVTHDRKAYYRNC